MKCNWDYSKHWDKLFPVNGSIKSFFLKDEVSKLNLRLIILAG